MVLQRSAPVSHHFAVSGIFTVNVFLLFVLLMYRDDPLLLT